MEVFENLGKYSAIFLSSKICLPYMTPFASTTIFLIKLYVHPVCCWLICVQENDALILALGLIVVLCMENPITGNSKFAYVGIAG